MKKYLSLLVVFLMVFVLGNQLAQAKDGENDSSDDTRIETSNEAEVEAEDKNDDSDNDGLDDSKEVKNRREEIKRLLESKREEFKRKIEIVREETKTKMEAFRENIKNEKDAVKAKIKELRIEGRERALERFNNAIIRINELKDKINAQILKLETKGVDVINAKNFVSTAETKLTEARNKIEEINALLVLSINELTLENKTKLKTLAKETQALIVEAHTALKEAVKSLRSEVKIKMEAKASTE